MINVKPEEVIKLAKSYVTSHYEYVQYFGNREDYVQSLILEVYRRLPSFDTNKGKFSTWCYIVFKHAVFMRIRHNSYYVQPNKTDEDIDEFAEHITDNLDSASDMITQIAAKDIIEQLKPYLSEAYILRYMYDKTFKQIAKITGVKYENIRERVMKENRKIKQMLKHEIKFKQRKKKNFAKALDDCQKLYKELKK